MYVDLLEFKNMYQICLPDNKVAKSLGLGHDYYKRMTSIKQSQSVSVSSDFQYVFDLPDRYFLFDDDYSWVPSPNDVKSLMFNNSTYNELDVSSYITEVKDYNHGGVHKLVVIFDNTLPIDLSSFPKLSFDYSITPLDLSDKRYQWFIKDYIALYALYDLLNTSDVSKLQTGVANYNMNGVDLSVDSSTIRSVLEDIKMRLNIMYNEFMPIVSSSFKGDYDSDSYYFSSDSNMSGNGSFSALRDRIKFR